MEDNESICCICGKIKYTPFHITEVNAEEIIEINACIKCAENYLLNPHNPYKPLVVTVEREEIDLSNIETAQDLIDIIVGVTQQPSCDIQCSCGLTNADFKKTGRFGCPNCYETFKDRIENQVYPYHNACEHKGKFPQAAYNKQQNTKEERLKTLKLKLAKAVEIEDYENAAILKDQLDNFKD
jgi:protein arginine kinase activator